MLQYIRVVSILDFDIIYSDRKTLGLSIKNSRLVVRAPKRFPKWKIKKIVEEHREWIDKHIEMQKSREDKFAPLTDAQIKQLKKLARVYFVAKAEYFASLMGLKYNKITITSAKTRFGSCSQKGNICFSYRLMLYPEPAREYVVVHELAHLVEMNHSNRFYAIIARVLPDYKARKSLLK